MMDEGMTLTKKYDVTSAAIKWVALITMFIDHIGAEIIEWVYVGDFVTDPAANDVLYYVDKVLRAIGRASFPLFVFMLIEGLFYTKSRMKYLIRLLVFCFISEVPFDLAFGYIDDPNALNNFVPLVWGHQNVFFTLAFGFAAIWLAQEIHELELPSVGEAILSAVAVGGFVLFAYYLKTDYGALGVLAIAAGYYAKRLGLPSVLVGAVIISILLFLSKTEAWAYAIDLPLLAFYHGTRGRRGSRWFFYIIYPVHFMILYLIRLNLF